MMQLTKINNNKAINNNSTSCITSLVQLLLCIPSIYLLQQSIYSFNEFGWAITHEGELPGYYNSIRSWWLFCTIFYLALFSVNIKILTKCHKSNIYIDPLSWYSAFIPLLSIIYLVKLFKERILIYFIKYIFSDRYDTEQINHKETYLWFTRKIKGSKTIRNTIIYYATLTSFTIGLILIFIPSQSVNSLNDGDKYFIFDIASYFTQQNNILCWLFLLLFMFMHKKQPFANNTLLTYNLSYIFIVGLVANIMIVPYLAYSNNDAFDAINMLKFFWLHLINQIFFVWFGINTFALNRKYKLEARAQYYTNGVIYPIFYGIYLYTLPFVSRHSVYGWLTNLNPLMLNTNNEPVGNPILILGLFGLIICFIFTLWFFRRINKIIIRNSQKFY